MSIIGIDPGLSMTGWGIINMRGNKLEYIASGTIKTNPSDNIGYRLKKIYTELCDVIKLHNIAECAIEETFVNKNPSSSLKLGQARGIAILAASNANINVTEYAPRLVKKALVGTGRAEKHQVAIMVKHLLPRVILNTDHESDALAVAICHANTSASRRIVNQAR